MFHHFHAHHLGLSGIVVVIAIAVLVAVIAGPRRAP